MKTIQTAIFDSQKVDTSVSAGCLLVAQPLLQESYFNHGVIALVDHGIDGSLGTVMNNPAGGMLHEVIDGVSPDHVIPVYNGGPMGQDRLYFLHNLGSRMIPGSTEFAPGVYLGGDFDAIREYIEVGGQIEGRVRFFVGYSSWSTGQLEDELRQGVWAIADCPFFTDELFEKEEDKYWHRTVKTLGDRYKYWKYFPQNLRAN